MYKRQILSCITLIGFFFLQLDFARYNIIMLYMLGMLFTALDVYKRQLKKNGVKLMSATEIISEGPEGIILESVLEGYAEYYSADLAEKVVRGQTENILKMCIRDRSSTSEICFRKVSFAVSNSVCVGCWPAASRAAFSRSSFI